MDVRVQWIESLLAPRGGLGGTRLALAESGFMQSWWRRALGGARADRLQLEPEWKEGLRRLRGGWESS
jgi:hypothetical protein